MTNSPIAHIEIEAIQQNLDYAKSLAPKSKVMAVVKAEAYGHGAARISRALRGVDAFAVARVEEGVALRAHDVELPIIVLEGFLDKEELDHCRIDRLVPVLHSKYQIDLLKSSQHAELGIWIKVDTGMHRLGFSAEEFRAGMRTGAPLNILGVMSHLANADAQDHPENHAQIEIFNELTRDLDCDLSIANSGAIINYPNSHFDWIRPGIMLYGGSPSGRQHDPRLKSAMTLTAPVISVNRVNTGETIGYGSSWVAKADTRVAVIGIGYADGYPREMPAGTPVIINGVRRSIIGRISMDMTFVEISHEDEVNPGDRVVLWGDALPIDEVASYLPTVNYTLMSGLTGRVTRSYSGQER